MKSPQKNAKAGKNKRGLALITVVSVLAIMTILTVAMLSLSQTEYSSSSQHADLEQSRELADLSVNLVMGQIWEGTKQDKDNSGIEFWASQPGAVRKYSQNGNFFAGYRLYSSATMVVKSDDEKDMIEDSDDDRERWDEFPARFVDLNEPIVRPAIAKSTSGTGTATPSIVFPIIDPRAYVRKLDAADKSPTYPPTLAEAMDRTSQPNVEGFFYLADVVSGTVDPEDTKDIRGRLPMPVEWVYVLKDGTLGALDEDNTFIPSPDGSNASVQNPIVGRIAFWADDETSKININTASEPTYWGVPSSIHDRDLDWAFYQPTAFEYQRYPGHPASVALSSVFFPNQDLDLYSKSPASNAYKGILKVKRTLYSMAPKIGSGGSESATIPYWKYSDAFTGYKDNEYYDKLQDMTEAMKKRLYSSPDELLFAGKMKDDVRQETQLLDEKGDEEGAIFEDVEDLERVRFFLTANSRMPETTLFGTPRVAIWPISDEERTDYQKYRTGYDQLIAFCSSMGQSLEGKVKDKSYYFRRANPDSPTYDIGIDRNQKLLTYLYSLMSEKMPGGQSFASKYGADAKQILVEIFDYVRSTNLYDGFLSPSHDTILNDTNYNRDKYGSEVAPDGTTMSPASKAIYDSAIYTFNEVNKPGNKVARYTYTRDRASSSYTETVSGVTSTPERASSRSFPGHGTVTPSQYENGAYMGFGRFPMITEVGFHFICTGDGATDKGSFVDRIPDGTEDVDDGAGGTTPVTRWKINDGSLADPLKAPKKSGGRTAVKMIEASGAVVGTARPKTSTDIDTQAYVVTLPDGTKTPIPFIRPDKWQVPGTYPNLGGAGQPMAAGMIQYWYSNYPPFPSAATCTDVFGVELDAPITNPNSPFNHPACDATNWNWTLEKGVPLAADEKRVQAQLLLKLGTVTPGFHKMNPDFTIRVSGLDKVVVGDASRTQQIFPNMVFWRSGTELWDTDSARGWGGNVNTFALSQGRRAKESSPAVRGGFGSVKDPGYELGVGNNSDPHTGTHNYDFNSSYFTVKGPEITMSAPDTSSEVVIELFRGHEMREDMKVQKYRIKMSDLAQNVPVPQLIILSSDWEEWTDANGNLGRQVPLQAPHWWCMNYGGAIDRATGKSKPTNTSGGEYNSLTGYILAPRPTGNSNGSTVGSLLHTSRRGILGRFYNGGGSDRINRNYAADNFRGLPRGTALIYAYDSRNGNTNSELINPFTPAADQPADTYSDTAWSDTQPAGNPVRDPRGTDVAYTVVPKAGDVRLLAGKAEVGPEVWTTHRKVVNLGDKSLPDGTTNYSPFSAHNLSRYNAFTEGGADRGPADNMTSRPDSFVYNASYFGKYPDVDYSHDVAVASQKYGDFDNGVGTLRDGSYINKADEGTTSITNYGVNNQMRRLATAYMGSQNVNAGDWRDAESGQSFMTPNRIIPSPGMFGSLPTGVKANIPWRTLLFRPHTKPPGNGTNQHEGSPGYQGGVDPADHYILDLFWMPIVEPYAISEPFSTAGKVNINYQMVPFQNYIRRTTGLHAVLKGEMMTAIPTAHAGIYKEYPSLNASTTNADNYTYYYPWSEYNFDKYKTSSRNGVNMDGAKFWHRLVETEYRSSSKQMAVQGTLAQFEDRFNFKTTASSTSKVNVGLFRSASQMCEMHLIPRKTKTAATGTATQTNGADSSGGRGSGSAYAATNMQKFWEDRAITGDNLRERVYANVYGKITTQSNTFRVHYRVQALRKARSTDPAIYNPEKDTVLSDYRGSSLIERSIDPTDEDIPDYADPSSTDGKVSSDSFKPLTDFYRFRVLEVKRFTP